MDEIQAEALEDSEIGLLGDGADPEDVAAVLAEHRAKYLEWREEMLADRRGMIGGGPTLQ